MASMLVLSLFALVLGVDFVASNDCCVADQFNVGFAGTKTKIIDSRKISFEPISDPSHNRRVRFQGEAAIDHIGHRYAANVSWYDYRQKTWGSIRFIKLINESTSYVIKDSKCFKKPACQREPPSCVPDDAYLVENMFIGKNSLQLNTWKMRMGQQRPVHGDLRFATTQENCIPVFSSLIGRRKMNTTGEYARFEVDGVFFNYTEALSPSSFVIPDICHNATLTIKDKAFGLLEEWHTFQEGMVFL